MCKFFILWNNFSKYKKLSNEIDNKYKKYCDDNILSNGICIVKNNKIKIKKVLYSSKCKNKIESIKLSNSPDYLFYHVRLPYNKKLHSVIVNNIHPFIFDNRYICMHNGLIKFKKNINKNILESFRKQIKGTTDSELFFALLLSIYIENNLENIWESLNFISNYITSDSLLNIVILDNKEDILIAYRGDHTYKDLPPLYLFSYGISNIKCNDDYIILFPNTLITRINKKNTIYKNYIVN
jgi:hypothetical protein